MKRQELNPKNTKLELSVRIINHILHSFEADYGRNELVKFMDKTGLPLKYFQNEYNWVSFEYHCNLLNQLVKYTGDKDIPYKYGMNIIKYSDSLGVMKTLFTLTPSPSYVYKTLVATSPRYSKNGIYKNTEIKKNKAIIEFQHFKNFKADKNNCMHIRGIFTSIPTFFGLPYANVKELQCAADGADSCIYEITWQKLPVLKNKIFSLLVGIFIVVTLYSIINWKIINLLTLAYIATFLIPIAFFLGGHVLDYKRTIKGNSEILDEQNRAIINSLQSTQEINEELQIKIDQRTHEINVANKKLEATYEQIRNTEKKLLVAERMRGVARLAAGVAHEINNPMGAVRNYIQEMIEVIPDADTRKPTLKKTEAATEESKILINDLLSFARMDEDLHIIEIDINEVIDKIIINVHHTFSNFNIKINKELESDLPIINSDPLQVNQIFTNLIINSYKAIKDKGEIKIKTYSKNDEIHVDIWDNGDIIPDYMIDKVFDPYQKDMDGIDRKELGLVISYNIVKRFNGDIKINSSADKGTTFFVSLPYI